jgi:hypothetical protein
MLSNVEKGVDNNQTAKGSRLAHSPEASEGRLIVGSVPSEVG